MQFQRVGYEIKLMLHYSIGAFRKLKAYRLFLQGNDLSYPLKRIANQFLEVFLNHQSCALRRGEFETVKIAYSCVVFVIKN